MKTKVKLFRTLAVLGVEVVAVGVAPFGVGLRTAETQTTPASTTTYYKVEDLGTLGGSSTYASAINDAGQVVGYSYPANGAPHAFLYDESATPKMTDLGTLGGTSSYAYDINNSGQVVGWSHNNSDANRAFIYDNTKGMRDLNTLIPADSGWPITSATAINSDGMIAATGYKEGVGTHALLLTPTSSDTPPPDDTEAPSPPTITSPQNNTYDTDGSFSVSGSAEAASTVELFESTTSKGTTTADSSGAWSIALSGVSEGSHTYAARATDAAGNTSSASNSVTVTVDTVAPKVDSVVPQEDPTGVATGVAPGVNVTATFTEGMQDASVKSAFKLYKKGTTKALGASVTYEAATRTATLDPSANLRYGTTYKAVVSVGAQDLAGNPLAQQKVWFFTVG
jgi:probable HAF family extracellular repeat protein